jgi:DUF4097 and DUF4098 domain-containing protein YvlB
MENNQQLKKTNNIWKWILGLAAATAICWGVAGVLAPHSSNPGFLNDLTVRLNSKSSPGVTVEKHLSEELAIDTVSTIAIGIDMADVSINTHDGPNLKVTLDGNVIEPFEFSVKSVGDEAQIKIESAEKDLIQLVANKDGLRTNRPKVVVLIPKSFLRDIKLAIGAGKLEVSPAQFANVELVSGASDVQVTDMKANSMKVVTGSGDMVLQSDVEKIEISTGTGDIRISSLKSKNVQIKSGTGDLHVEQMAADELKIDSGTGDVRLKLAEISNWTMDVSSGTGDISIVGYENKSTDSYEPKQKIHFGNGPSKMKIAAGTGDITIQ